jgi:hypothetical protein
MKRAQIWRSGIELLLSELIKNTQVKKQRRSDVPSGAAFLKKLIQGLQSENRLAQLTVGTVP